ncbi:hypothetical protein GCM10010435_14570 [Winogradskya consettensis]|uniref:Glycosyltransferase RgtA/B/C/D-like domain-containing protein n=1 Tax=Winogradskya consettensis TaxID=113560 RepID=A0A919SCC5_9ACTN|nr:glycosyltransferase family 39 protein [Actinoplanes consettensis]GIM69126.1 hypothetical protein Aco04nite_13840 [Actinoplanes consettensis]
MSVIEAGPGPPRLSWFKTTSPRECAISSHLDTSPRLIPAQQEPVDPVRSGVSLAAVLIWAVPALTAAGLAGWRLTGASLWADELATWGAVRLSWAQLWQLSGTVDAVVAPYYAALKAWCTLAGTGSAALRLPSALAIVGATVVVTALGRRIGGVPAGLVAGLLFALVPATSRYGQEARPYALAMFFAVLAVLCLVRLVEAPGVLRAIGYAASVAATGLLHPLGGLLMVAGHATAIGCLQLRVDSRNRRSAVLWLGAAFAGSVPALVLAWWGTRQSAQISWIPLATVDSLQGLPQNVFASAAVGGILLVLAVLGTGRSLAAVVLAGAGFVPPALLLIVGTQTPLWVGRYVMIAIGPLAVLGGLGALRAGKVPATLVIVLALLFSWPVQLEFRTSSGHAEDSAKIASVIGPRYRAGDVVVFPDTHPSIPWAARDIYERYLPAPRPPDVLRVAAPRTSGRLLARECPGAACLGTPPRIWVIRVDNSTDPLKDMTPAKRRRIGEHYRTVQSWKFPLLGVTLMERSEV